MKSVLFACALLGATPALAVNTTASTDATAMATSLAGAGFNIVSATLTSNTQNGFFSGGGSALGINSGVVLTTGTLACIGSANTLDDCAGSGNTSTLSIDFTLDGDNLFFNYVFGSEEYNEFVGSEFNDSFQLLLDGVNLAQLPGGGGVVSINNVNNDSNSAFFRDNTDGTLPIQLDGLTTVLTASANGVSAGLHTLTFVINDVGDANYDSAVFIQAGTVSTDPTTPGVPEPASWAMMLVGFGAVGGALRSRRKATVSFG